MKAKRNNYVAPTDFFLTNKSFQIADTLAGK